MFESKRPLLPDILALHGKWRANKPAIVHLKGVASWRTFVLATNRVANGIRAAGLNSGDRVGLLMGNEVATVEIIFGLICAGMVVVPINLSVPDAAAAAMLDDAAAVSLFVSGDQLAKASAIRAALPNLRPEALFVADARSCDLPAGWRSYEIWRDCQSADMPMAEIGDDALMNIIYSSGTTGVPKGIAHTHLGRLDWAYDLAIALRYHGSARTLLTLGLYSNISWVMMLCTLLAGGTLVLHSKFDAGATLRAINECGVTHAVMVPVQYRRLLDHPDFGRTNLTRVQSLMSCGSALPVDLKERLLKTFPCGVIELYGLTEGVITILDPEDAGARLSSVGRPIQGSDIRLIDEHGREVSAGEPGEIVGKSRFTMLGYWNRVRETADATWFDARGDAWLRTGDIGRLDEDGFLYIVDRKKDMILSGGQNIYPADIEAVLLTHPSVLECAVIGVPHLEWGETPLAVIVPRDHTAEAKDLHAWINARIGRQQRVSAVAFADQLPRNPNGKVLKRELYALYGARIA